MRRPLALASLLAAAVPSLALAAPPPSAQARGTGPAPAPARARAPEPAAAPAAPAAPAAARPRVLVLPLLASQAIDPELARAFDARLLVALDDTRRVVTITPSEEPECASTSCLAALGAAEDAAYVLSLTAVREAQGLALFGTLVETRTATAARRLELSRLEPASVARTAPAELVPQIVGAAAGPVVLGVAHPVSEHARAAAFALHDRLSASRAFKVLPLDGSDRSPLTHRAELVLSELGVVERRRHLCTWRDGTLVGTFAITELATGRAVFSKTLRITETQRAVLATRDEIIDAMLETAIDGWMAAFRESGLDSRFRRSWK